MRKIWLILLLSLLTAFPPISTSMYLPAIPMLQKAWHEPLAVVNLTLVAFFVSYCVFLLVYGPLSDRFGRRRPLLVGMGLYVLSSLLCALVNSAPGMILLRVLQGSGAASASSLALAISKDLYEGRERGRVLATIGTIMAVAPMVAPILGGFILTGFSWRWIFVTQALVASVAWVGTLLLGETLKKPTIVPVLHTVRLYLDLFNNGRYMVYTLMGSLIGLAHFAFIGGSADIYITRIGLSEQIYSYFFSLNGSAMMIGAFVCGVAVRRFKATALIPISFAGIALGAFSLIVTPFSGPWGVAMSTTVMTFFYGLNRPMLHNLILEQADRNAGAASSFLTFCYYIVGAFSMWLIALNWSDKVVVLGLLGALSGGVMLTLWLVLQQFAAAKR